MRITILALAVLTLTGCAQQIAMQQQQEAEMAAASAKSVCESVPERPELAILKEQVVFDYTKATVAQLADNRKPTAAQKAVIANIDQYNKPCEDAAIALYSKYTPRALPIYMETSQSVKMLWARLLNGDMTFGQFNTEKVKLASTAQARATQLHANLQAEAQQLQLQQQQLGIQNMQLWNSMRPRTANCYRVGNSVSCTQW